MFYMILPMILIIILILSANNKMIKMIFTTIIFTFTCSMSLFYKSINSWISFSLFMALVGGILVLFSLVYSSMLKSKSYSFFSDIFLMIPLIWNFMEFYEKMEFKMSPFNYSSVNFFSLMFILFILNLILTLISNSIALNEKILRSLNSLLKL